MNVLPYTPDLRERWNAFVKTSRNGTFLLDRRYMDYHVDRFVDSSLILADGPQWVALLPANRRGDVVESHGGLTYGGFVLGDETTTPQVLDVCTAAVAALRDAGAKRLRYKTIPWPYHRLPSEDDRYALFRHGATVVRRDVLSVVSPSARGPVQERRARGAKRAERDGVTVGPSEDLDAFWEVLAARLAERHDTRPVHTVNEMRLLQSRFPDNIQLHAATLHGELVAGVLVYATARVAHAQYIASSEAGRRTRALDLLFNHLIVDAYRSWPWFDFGISTESDGQVLNTGLVEQKEGFGARAVVHDHYDVDLA